MIRQNKQARQKNHDLLLQAIYFYAITCVLISIQSTKAAPSPAKKEAANKSHESMLPQPAAELGVLIYCNKYAERLSKWQVKKGDVLTLKLARNGIKHLRQYLLKGGISLKGIDAAEAEVDDSGLELISKFKSLELLNLSHTSITGKGLALLTRLTALKTLDLSNTDLRSKDIEAVSKMQSLAYLNLSRTEIDNDAIVILSKKNNWKGLRFHGTETGDQNLALLTKADSLELIDFGSSKISEKGLAELCKIKNLHVLELRGARVKDSWLPHLFTLKNLKELDLSQTKISDSGACEVLKNMPGLQALLLKNNKLSANCISALASAIAKNSALNSLNLADTESLNSKSFTALTKFSRLKCLDLSKTSFADNDMKSLKSLSELEQLNLAATKLENPDFSVFVPFNKLKVLNLSDTAIGDPPLVALSKISSLAALELDQTQLSNASLKYFHAMPALKKLDIFGTGMSLKTVEKFKRAHPQIELTF